MKRFISILLSVTMLFSIMSIGVFATDDTLSTTSATQSIGDTIKKGFYNVLNEIVEGIVKTLCDIYPDPDTWKDISENTSENFLAGRETYQTEAKAESYWSLGYASESVVPDDIDCGNYYLGRDLNVKKANGCYDDMRIRVTVLDDNSGEGAVVLAALDCLGITNTDVRSIREAVLKYCDKNDIKVSSINIGATHCHSALDTQGVSTEFFYKLFGNFLNNSLNIFDELPNLEYATSFKQYFISQSIKAVEEAFDNIKPGTMSYGTIDTSSFVYDKRELVSAEDIPETLSIKFTPNDQSESTYITLATCHPTSFSASNGYVSSDYIYYLEKYIKEQTGANFMLLQGSLGQISRDIEVDYSKYTDEYSMMKAQSETLGNLFGEYILKTDYSTELDPIINVKAKEIFIVPSNSVLRLACEIKLVNNQVYYNGDEEGIISEMGYLELGHKVGFAMFPGELYPEVFWGDDIIDNASWDGTEWQYDSLHDSVDGVDVYPISLMNDATGYVVTDNNFAFMGHIIGDSISDEILSAGKNEGSFLVSNYLDLVNDYTK